MISIKASSDLYEGKCFNTELRIIEAKSQPPATQEAAAAKLLSDKFQWRSAAGFLCARAARERCNRQSKNHPTATRPSSKALAATVSINMMGRGCQAGRSISRAAQFVH